MGKKLIPLKNKADSDRIYTPDKLAQRIVRHYNPFGKKCLDPCKGTGAFLKAFQNLGINADWCEIDEGRDFFEYDEQVDWVISNFPWSLHRDFLLHSMEISNDIVTLVTVNHVLGLKARMRDIRNNGFYIREILYIEDDEYPENWPKSGFSLAAIHISRNRGDCRIDYL